VPILNDSLAQIANPYETIDRVELMKMAVLTSSDFMNIDVIEGRDATIEFTVQNKSSLAWPFKPFVQNEKDKSVK